MEKQKIFLADDHQIMREGLKALLDPKGTLNPGKIF